MFVTAPVPVLYLISAGTARFTLKEAILIDELTASVSVCALFIQFVCVLREVAHTIVEEL